MVLGSSPARSMAQVSKTCATGWRHLVGDWSSQAALGTALGSRRAYRRDDRNPFVPDKLKIAIAEDHYLVREGTRRLLEDSGEVDVVAAVGTPAELHDAIRRLKPDAVITDIRMPPGHHMEGIDAAHAIRSEHPEIGVVVLSQHADPAYALELLKNGSAGLAYLLKERLGDVTELLRALREVVAGGSVIDPS